MTVVTGMSAIAGSRSEYLVTCIFSLTKIATLLVVGFSLFRFSICFIPVKLVVAVSAVLVSYKQTTSKS